MNLNQQILNGDFDEHLERLARAILTRRSMLAAKIAERPLMVGDVVEIIGGLRPAYLTGLRGEIVSLEYDRKRGDCARIALGADARRFANAEPLCPLRVLKLVTTADMSETWAVRKRTKTVKGTKRRRAIDL